MTDLPDQIMSWVRIAFYCAVLGYCVSWFIKVAMIRAMRKVNKETLPAIDGVIRGAVNSGVLDALRSFEEELRKFEDRRREQ